MVSRMDRYNSNNNTEPESRLSKNEILYKEISNNKTYTEFTSLDKDNVFEISNKEETANRRSNYNRNNIFNNNINTVDNSNNTFNSYSKILEPTEKNYNINEVLEEARKNRSEMLDTDKNKKLKSVEYSIINDLSKEKIKEYREKKESGITQEEEDNLEELIHTITSNSLRKRIDDELLNELLPDENEETEEADIKISESDIEEIKNAKDEEKEEDTEEKEDELDDSFYTRSMDLRKEDLVFEDIEEEVDESFKDSCKGNVFKNILIVILVIAVLSIIGFVIYKFI